MRVTQASTTEVSEYLVGSAAFKAVGTGDPRPAGSIPVHLRHSSGSLVLASLRSRSPASTASLTFVV